MLADHRLADLSPAMEAGAVSSAGTGAQSEVVQIGQRQNSSRGVPSGHMRLIQIFACPPVPASGRPATWSSAGVAVCTAGPAVAATSTVVSSRSDKPDQKTRFFAFILTPKLMPFYQVTLKRVCTKPEDIEVVEKKA